MTGCTGYPVGPERPVLAYTDDWSVVPGGIVDVKVSTLAAQYRANVVRLPAGTDVEGWIEPADGGTTAAGVLPGILQHAHPGSGVVVPGLGPALAATRTFMIDLQARPAVLPDRRQGLVGAFDHGTSAGVAVVVEPSGRLGVLLGDGTGHATLVCPEAMAAGQWSHVLVLVDLDRRLVVAQQRRTGLGGDGRVRTSRWPLPFDDLPLPADLILAASGRVEECGALVDPFDGSLADVAVWAGPSPSTVGDASLSSPPAGTGWSRLAGWHLGRDTSAMDVRDTAAGSWPGECVNLPERGAPDHTWRGGPGGRGAAAFHADDLADARWRTTCRVRIPRDARSGVYAVRLTVDGAAPYDVPFVVRAPAGARAPLVVVMPTFTYLAYGNDHHLSGRSGPAGQPEAARLHRLGTTVDGVVAEGIGGSLYDRHPDGSGVTHSSRHRPLLNVRPGYRAASTGGPREFSADLLIIGLLDDIGVDYHVVTDDDVHENPGTLAPYSAVVTGSHPEYASGRMLDALDRYLHDGGNLAYLGGNGFYWVTTTYPDVPGVIEVRRGMAGTRTWESRPGEEDHASTGERGGLWRHRGRPPQLLVGVGFTAQGSGPGGGYRRAAGSHHDEAAFVFAGIAADEIIGPPGPDGPGAASDETDRADATLGSPPGTLVLASAELGPGYLPLVEDVMVLRRGRDGGVDLPHDLVRADMVLVQHPGGGSVFSVGSVGWCASFADPAGRTTASARLTGNVLAEFARRPPPRGAPPPPHAADTAHHDGREQ